MKEESSRKAGTLMDKSVFGYFKRLINEDDEVRVQGACSLIEFLCNDKVHKQNGSTDVDSETSPKIAETAYSLKRLVRGVGSTQNASRAGFFTTLVGLLEQLKGREDECPTVTELLALAKSELTDLDAGSDEEGRGKEKVSFVLRIGKILVCGAIIKSGLVQNASDLELQSVCKTLQKNMLKTLTSLVYTFLTELAPQLDASRFSTVFWPVFEPRLNVTKEHHSLDSVFFLLQLSAAGTFKKQVNQKYFERNFGAPKLVHKANFANLAELLFRIDSTMAINHPIYDCLLEQLKQASLLVDFWRDAVVPMLERERKSRPKHCHIITLRLAITIFSRFEMYDQIPEILQPGFMKFLCNGLKNRTKLAEDIRNLFQEACVALVDCYPKMTDEAIRLATFRRLMQAPSSVLVEKYASCKLLQNLLVTLSAESLRSVAGELRQLILDESNGTNAERSYEAHMLHRLLSLPQLKTEAVDKAQASEWHQDVVRFFLVTGVFYSADGVEVLKSSQQEKALSAELATTLRGLFYHSLEHQHAKLSNEHDFLLSLVRHIDDTMRTHAKSLRCPLNDEQMTCWKKMMATVASGGKKEANKRSSTVAGNDRPGKQCDTVFHILLMHMGLHLFSDPELACSSIVELECVMKRIDEKAKQRRMTNGKPASGKKAASGELIEEEAEPEWIEVVVDLFLNLLSQNSHLLRKVIGHVFPHLSNEITLPALNQILSVINLKDKSNPLTAAGEEEEEEDVEMEDGEEEVEEGEDKYEDEGDEEAQDGNSEEEAENLDSETANNDEEDEEEDDDEDDEIMGDEEEEENITDKMRQAVQSALGGANPETDTESVDLDEMDEEQGRRLDEALAAAFRAFRKSKPSNKRKGPTKAEKQMDTVLTHFRMRVLDLIDAYLKHEPDMMLCLELMLYIFEMLPLAIREESKYGAILKRYRQIFNNLIRIKKFKRDAQNVAVEQLNQILCDLVEKVAKGVAFPERNQYLLQACQFIVMCSQILGQRQDGKQNGKVKDTNLVDTTIGDLLTQFLTSRNPPLAFNVFQSLFRMQWSGNWHLATTMASCGLKTSSVRAIRRIQALQLLRELLRNRRLINSNPARANEVLQALCTDALAPYVTEVEAAIGGSERSIGQNEVYELLQVLTEVQNVSSLLTPENAGGDKKGRKKSQLLRWDQVGAQVQAMRRFAFNSQTMTTYRQLCQRLKLTPIGNEGLPAEKEHAAASVAATEAVTVDDANKKGKKKQKAKKMNGATEEESVPNGKSMVNGNGGSDGMMNGHAADGGAEEEPNEDGVDQPKETKRKRKKERRADEPEGLSKKEKRRRKLARLQAASEGMEGISFADVAADL